MTAAGVVCGSCGTELSAEAKFCSECGMPLTSIARPAEYKQVTVLFADVVHSMDIAAAVGAERLREIMAELVTLAAKVVQRYGGTVDKFTGDGIMAVFGAPVALEDHAFRACLAALGIADEGPVLRHYRPADAAGLKLIHACIGSFLVTQPGCPGSGCGSGGQCRQTTDLLSGITDVSPLSPRTTRPACSLGLRWHRPMTRPASHGWCLISSRLTRSSDDRGPGRLGVR
jgi:hypothetical protein